MQSLKEVMAALREEIASAVAGNKPLSENVRLEADRVVVTLGFQVEKEAGQAVAFKFGTDSDANSLCIEFRCQTGDLPSIPTKAENAAAPPAARATRELSDTEIESVVRQLSQVFGAPGFDSSARATVFLEAFENLSVSEVGALVELFSSTGSTPPSDQVKRSQGLIRRICDAGPSGREGAKKILARVFAEFEAAAVLDLVSSTWKHQQHWLG